MHSQREAFMNLVRSDGVHQLSENLQAIKKKYIHALNHGHIVLASVLWLNKTEQSYPVYEQSVN